MERDKCFLSLFIVFVRDLILSFPLGPRRNLSDGKKETISITTFKKWPFANDFRIETKDGKVLSALCKYCSDMEYNDFHARGKFCKNSVNEGILLVGNDIKKLA